VSLVVAVCRLLFDEEEEMRVWLDEAVEESGFRVLLGGGGF
jgi:hypothetical protein